MHLKYENIFPTIHRFTERKWWPSRTLEIDSLSLHHLTYVLFGEATYIINGKEFNVSEGDILYIPKGSSRKAFTNPENPIHIYNIMFDYCLFNEPKENLPFDKLVNVGSDRLLNLFRELNQLCLDKDQGSILKSRGVFLLILHRLLFNDQVQDKKYKEDSVIKSLKQYISQNYHRKITNRELALKVNLHPVYMGAYFKKHEGCSISEYIMKVRISRAEDLLASGEYTVTETAYECGYENVYYFSKVFKRIKGISPSSYINGY